MTVWIPGEVQPLKEEPLNHWQQLQYGMFIHFGLYSVLGGEWKGEPVKKGYSEQIQMWANIPTEEYEGIAKEFSIENFDPDEICSLAKDAGMNYIVITTKHHDGFCLFDTKTTDYNIVQATPFKQDVIKLLSEACERHDLGFGIYYSLVDWHLGHSFDYDNNNPIPAHIESKIEEQLTELMTNYGPIVEVWFDMSSPTEEQSELFKNIVRQYQPKAAINGRIWNNRGDFRTLNDNQIPDKSLSGPWQTPASIYQETWGYRQWQERTDVNEKALHLLQSLISVRARGGNYLLNIGPRGDGSIVEFEADVLKKIGKWLKRHPKAVLGTHSTQLPKQSWGEMTVNHDQLYLHVFHWPESKEITVSHLITDVLDVKIDNSKQSLSWSKDGHKLKVTLPEEKSDELITTIKVVLADELRVIPEKIVPLTHDGCEIDSEQLERAYNYEEKGNYTSLVETNFKKLAYLHRKDFAKDEMTLTIEGDASQHVNYRIRLNGFEKVVNGKDVIGKPIGPFTLSKDDDLFTLEIALHNPIHLYQDLQMTIDRIQIK